MTKTVPDGRAELFEHQMPAFERAIKDNTKSFDEAVEIARREPWPAGVASSMLHDVVFYQSLPQDNEGERKKKAKRNALPDAPDFVMTNIYLDSEGRLVDTETHPVKITHYDHTGRKIAYVDLDISDEVKEAIRLPLHQRKLFGSAKDRGMSDADALAFAKAPSSRDAYRDRLINAWRTPNRV